MVAAKKMAVGNLIRLQMRSGLRRRARSEILAPLFHRFLGSGFGIVWRGRSRPSSRRQFRCILQRQLAGRSGKRFAGFRGRAKNFVVNELVAVRMHPFAFHKSPSISRLEETSARTGKPFQDRKSTRLN